MLDWLLNSLGDLSGLAAAIWQAIIFLFNLIVALANFLLKLILKVLALLLDALKAIGKFFHLLWDSFFKEIFVDLFKALRAAHSWLESHLGPVIKAIQQYQAWLDRMFRLYIKPVLNLIQHVRQVLGVLRLLGIKWAGALDAKLGKVEADIAGIFLRVRAIFTNAIDILNAIADPLGLLRRPTIVLSIRRIIPALVSVCTGRPIGYFMPSPRRGVAPGLGPLPLNFVTSDPVYNPPPSSFFPGDDGLGVFSGFADGTVPDDTSVDDLDPLDPWDDSLWPPPACTDFATCLRLMTNQALNTSIVTTQGN